MKKVSVGQIMAELLCYDENDPVYNNWSNQWNKISHEIRFTITDNIRNYLENQIGKENLEKY